MQKNTAIFKQKALVWASAKSPIICYLDSNQYQNDAYAKYECLLAVGAEKQLKCHQSGTAFEALKAFAKQNKKWLFGYFSYDLKNEVEELNSQNEDNLGFPELYFFVPSYLILIDKKGKTEILSEKESPAAILEAIQKIHLAKASPTPLALQMESKITKESYLKTISKIKKNIVDGDIYEMNFCQEFFTKTKIEPLPLFQQLNQLSKAPYAAYLAINDHYLLCGSPERFLCKRGNKIISQPIKGTIKRGATPSEDAALQAELYHSEKDRAENVMIVDLVRNDLTKTSQTGTIKVEELFKIYSFEKVHQMISTIVAQKKEGIHWTEVIKEAYPIGSMTGAPKVLSLELIEQYEQSKRGLYAGAVGYVSPKGDFDFNVVIRSLLYHAPSHYLAFQVGGAIVYDSDPAAEYAECLLKAQNMLEVLGAI